MLLFNLAGDAVGFVFKCCFWYGNHYVAIAIVIKDVVAICFVLVGILVIYVVDPRLVTSFIFC